MHLANFELHSLPPTRSTPRRFFSKSGHITFALHHLDHRACAIASPHHRYPMIHSGIALESSCRHDIIVTRVVFNIEKYTLPVPHPRMVLHKNPFGFYNNQKTLIQQNEQTSTNFFSPAYHDVMMVHGLENTRSVQLDVVYLCNG